MSGVSPHFDELTGPRRLTVRPCFSMRCESLVGHFVRAETLFVVVIRQSPRTWEASRNLV
jgi:hypothetical protein